MESFDRILNPGEKSRLSFDWDAEWLADGETLMAPPLTRVFVQGGSPHFTITDVQVDGAVVEFYVTVADDPAAVGNHILINRIETSEGQIFFEPRKLRVKAL